MNIQRTSIVPRRTNVLAERIKDSTAGARYAVMHARAKSNSAISPYCVPNEYICAELGRYLRLPIAPGAIITDDSDTPKHWYASLDFSRDGELLLPISPEDCFQLLPDLCAGTVLFDILIANGDRHTRNLFLDESGEIPQLRLFDHEYALLGCTPGQAEGRLTGSLKSDIGIPNHCLYALVKKKSLAESPWIERILNIQDYFIEETCAEAAQYGMNKVETDAAIAFLKQRRNDMPRLIRADRSRKRT